MANGFTEVTIRERIEAFGPYGIPKWKRVIAPLDHWYRVKFRGHKPVDVMAFNSAHETPGRGAPRCNACGSIVGSCECSSPKWGD